MPLFSSLSVRDSNHPNKLEKTPHTRRTSLTGRKTSLARKGAVDEDASTRAVAGSSSRLMASNTEGNPITPVSILGDQAGHQRDQSTDQMEMRDKPPTPPPHDDVDAAEHTEDAGNRDSTHTSSTWRENPAMRNKDAFVGTYGRSNMDTQDQSASYAPIGDRPVDLSIARRKVQIAVEAELAADRAIEIARQAVIEARTVVAAIEKQVNEEFERAHARRLETAGVLKDLEKLGRHNN